MYQSLTSLKLNAHPKKSTCKTKTWVAEIGRVKLGLALAKVNNLMSLSQQIQLTSLQFLRSAPLLIIPILIPVNMDMLFIEYGLFFYIYGVYLHWGYELPGLSAHNPIVNTSYQVRLVYYLYLSWSLLFQGQA